VLVIDAKINKMCCSAKENTCFLLNGLFCYYIRRFNGLAEYAARRYDKR